MWRTVEVPYRVRIILRFSYSRSSDLLLIPRLISLVPHQTITPHSRKHLLPLVTELSRRNPKSPGLILLPAMGTAELGKFFGTPDPRQY
jgi:hypothetical protein